MKRTSYSHLSIDERKLIESLLNVPDITLKQIALQLNRSPKCIRYEISHHRAIRIRANQHNKCGRQNSCTIQRLCTHCITGLCKGCTHDNCNELCDDFISIPVCKRTIRFPYVCSNCPDIKRCKMPKYFYIASYANNESIRNNSLWRLGPNKTDLEMKDIISVLSDGIQKKQSIDTIIHTNQLPISTSTVYRYINGHYIDGISNIDLKRKVRYKPRESSKAVQTPIDYDYLNDRSYEDYVNILESLDLYANVWEMDTVIGKKGVDEKCVLTLLHQKSNLQLYFLLEHKNCLEVNKVFDKIKQKLGKDLFKEMFTLILTDNGSEFKDPLSIETDCTTGEVLTHLYFCRPRRSDDKGKCEKNHEHFRECVPSGTSMNSLTEKDINYISKQVNNYPRRKLNYQSPYEVAQSFVKKKVFSLNRLSSVSAKAVNLTPIVR